MNLRKILFSAGLVLITAFTQAQQPYSGCWHPDFIKDWTPEKDPDVKFNRSSVPLQPRIQDDVLKANRYQFKDGQVAPCLTMHPSCSQVPAQGANNFIGYNPTYWQYMDLLIWWGGSAGEGIILPPSAPVIDAAHLSGVKVLGQVFFPPTAFGGQVTWTQQMLTKEGDQFPYARKLVEIAEFYGFDGWFINDETIPGNEAWNDFVIDYLRYAREKGLEEQEIQYYYMRSSVESKFFPMFKEPGASYFVNYYGITTNNVNTAMDRHANEWGLGREDAFRTYYWGIEQAQMGMLGNGNYYQTLFPKTGHIGSVQIFNPEEHIWKKVVESLLNTENACGETAYQAIDFVFKNEARFWTNAQNDPSSETDRDLSNWPGLANAIVERSAIQSLPFVSTFSAGLGKHRFVNGEKKGTQDWYHRGMQTVMPTWRWWLTKLHPQATLAASLSFDDAYNMGTSIVLEGSVKALADNILRLYKTKIAISSGDKVQLVYKTNTPGSVTLKLATSDNTANLTDYAWTSTSTKGEWTVAEFDMSALAGKTLSVVALGFKNSTDLEDYKATLGQIAIYPANYNPATAAVSNLKIENELGVEKGNLRVVWDKPTSEDVHHFNVYMERNGVKTLVGQTRNEGFFIPTFERESSSESVVKIFVTAVNKDMKEGNEVSVQANFSRITAPDVQLKAEKTLIALEEEVKVIAKANKFPTKYEWVTPEGATLVRADQDTAVFKFNKAGLYDIQVAVSNAIGTTTEIERGLINVSATTTLTNVSTGKTIQSCSGSLPPENPEWIVDGVQVPGNVREKWCAGGLKEHWVVIDLKKEYEIYRFQWFDCGNKENYSDNTKFYKIYVSNTLAEDDWTLVVDESDRPENTKDDYIKPSIGRYVKFVPYDPETPITIRIWEFEVYALEPVCSINQPDELDMYINDEKEIKLPFMYNAKESNFNITVTPTDNTIAQITDQQINEESKTVTFKVNALKLGETDVTVKMTNGTNNIEKIFKVTVSLLNDITQPDDLILEEEEEKTVTLGFKYTQKEENFAITVTAKDNEIVEIAELKVDDEELEISFKVKGLKAGKSDVTVKMVNGEATVEKEFNVTVTEIVGIDNSVENKVNIYPNPVRQGDDLYISGNVTAARLLSMQGTLVKEIIAAGNETVISTTDIQSGVYLLQVISDNRINTTKVIVK